MASSLVRTLGGAKSSGSERRFLLWFQARRGKETILPTIKTSNCCSCRSSPASLLPDLPKPFICSWAMSPNSGPNTRVIHQSCVCVYLCVRVWSAVSAPAISALIHQPPDSSEVTLCDIWGHFTFSSTGEREEGRAELRGGENCFHV